MGSAISMIFGSRAISLSRDLDHDSDHRLIPSSRVSSDQDSNSSTQFMSIFFGSVKKPWQIENWIEVSDTVRGGSSHAKLEYLDPSNRSIGVRFQGTLDTKTLGGAGFASQAYRQPVSVSGKKYLGFFIEVNPTTDSNHHAHQPIRHFTFTAKNVLPTQTHDRRQNSTLSYEFDFEVPLVHASDSEKHSEEQLIRFEVPFRALKPTYRGRPQRDAKAFDPHKITELSFMCRSFFNQQSGPFHLDIIRFGLFGTVDEQNQIETNFDLSEK